MMRSVLLPLFLFATVIGCYPLRDGHSYFPTGAINLPTGTVTRQWQSAQADKARGAGLVLYEASWIDGSYELGPAAIDRLTTACGSDQQPLGMVTLEPSQNEALDNQRVQAVLNLANSRGITLPPEAIVVARPDGNRLYGEESVQVAREMMQGNRRVPNPNVFGPNTGGMFGGPSMGGFGGFP